MSLLQVYDLSFTHQGETAPLFSHVNLTLDTSWHLGLIGRNGRGKTTLLKILMGEHECQGRISCPEAFEYYPLYPENAGQTARTVARRVIAPFDEWEAAMRRLEQTGTDASMLEYGEIQAQYAAADGYVINEAIEAETSKLGIHSAVLDNPFKTLSGGEQVKLLLAAMFLKKHVFLLIDEPTDHLDEAGRKLVARWLRGKPGYILVSHDRAFLDECIDHVLSINRADIELQRGNYSTWRANRSLKDNFEQAEHDKLTADIGRLKDAASRAAKWSDKIEKTKKGGSETYNRGAAEVDRGYIGHQAARMMQRSKSIERRQNREIEEKEALLKNLETPEPLKIWILESRRKNIVTAENLGMSFQNRMLFSALDFVVNAGDRVSVEGPNGSGKSTLLKLILGKLAPTCGHIRLREDAVVSYIPQDTAFLHGSLQQYALDCGLELSIFLAILRKLDFDRESFTRTMENYSMGEKKKVTLAASLAKPAHLLVWDEPLNYVDVLSREQIESALLNYRPSIIFVEHDAVFTEKIANQRIQL